MKTLPFSIQKLVFRNNPALKSTSFKDDHPVQLINVEDCPETNASIPGYFVMSSAPPNIDEKSDDPVAVQKSKIQNETQNARLGIDEITRHLYNVVVNRESNPAGANPELVITVHGYNTRLSAVQNWYRDIFLYINQYDSKIAAQGSQVFVGYRWPSENIELQRTGEAIAALPPLPRDMLIVGLVAALVILIRELMSAQQSISGFFLTVLFTLLVFLGVIIVALILLRLAVYFRDRYRANNFGVLDLVELLRQIDRDMVRLKIDDIKQQEPDCDDLSAQEKAIAFWQNDRCKIKLSFLGHSMGAFVVTNAMRILSDVFDAASIDKQPTSAVGSVFQLERLLLASPDIPVLTIISSRANFLASSLRRFAESYLFSSEGDIALRIASTAANYIAFPSRTQSRGYRLGNVALTHDKNTRDGIMNLESLAQQYVSEGSLAEAIVDTPSKVLENLFVTSKRMGVDADASLADLFAQQMELSDGQVTVADFFTFFDCTNYKDVKFQVRTNQRTEKPVCVLTHTEKTDRFNTLDYIILTLEYMTGRRNVHGGYFNGDFSQQMVYRILFLGFSGYLKTVSPDTSTFNPREALKELDSTCKAMKIQGFLSPIRYWVDVRERPAPQTMRELLAAIAERST